MNELWRMSRRFKTRALSTQQAFTLIEIILVVLVLSVVVGLTAPNLSKSLTKHQFEKSADELLNLMRYAQSRAISKGYPVQLVFNDDYREYWLAEAGQDHSDHAEDASFERIPGRMGTTRRVPEGVELRAEDVRKIEFYTDGRMDKAEISVCKKRRCRVLSTRIQRGFIRAFDSGDQY